MSTATAPVAQRVRAELRQRIERGEWQPGMPLPSEAALCREFGTSRGPVRRALSALRAEGFVVGGRGRPPVVGRVVPAQSLTTFRSFTEWARAEGKAPGTRIVALERRHATSMVAGLLELDEGATVVDLVRVRLLDDVPIMIERASFPTEVGRHLFGFDPERGSVSAELARHGCQLASARHTIDAVSANRLDAEMLGVHEGAPLLRERRRSQDASGRAVEYADARYRSEYATFRVDNRAVDASPIEVRADS
ncbi:GntR family transcriptional regulator [Agromyces sp. LHK192]|uniref:GntR family transcriptional regulator n=1 Tax=Agromyces sp. LHK192 TaxID=2498704 RepID=UPI000FD6FC87|nr:GntR family transcriptional regulator [Agromyces sp. LHK192]